jgi:hypothetical protein
VIRIVRDGIAFECDDVASAIELADALKPQPLLPLVAPRRVKVKATKAGKATPPIVRGASPGALDGRILAVLAAGPKKPLDGTRQVGAKKEDVRAAFKGLEASGKTRAEGGTTARRWMLAGVMKTKATKGDPGYEVVWNGSK